MKSHCQCIARGVALGIVLLLSAGTATARAQSAHTEGRASEFTIDGDAAVWVVAIKPDKTEDFERVMTRLREALQKSQKPERQQQAAGWKLLKVGKPMPDGNVAYVHVLDPVIPGANYGVLQVLYDEFPDERQALYELYRGAFAQSLSLVSGSMAVDLTKTQ